MRLALLTAFALFAVAGVFAGPANATVVTFDDAEADIGPLLKMVDPLCDDPDRAGATFNKNASADVSLTGAPDGNGVAPVTVTSASWTFPTWKTQLSAGGPPTDLDVNIFPTANITGTYDVSGANAGSLALNAAPFNSVVTIQSGAATGAVCTSAANQWAFTTENGPPGQVPEPGEMLGQDFTTALPPANGAAVALWDSLQPFTPNAAPFQPACDQIALGTSGPGGLWLANGLTVAQRAQAPPPTPNTPTTPPAKKKCKKGQKLKKGKCVKKKKKKK